MPRLVPCPRCQTPMEAEEHLFETHKGRWHDIKTLVWSCPDCGDWIEEAEKSHRILASSEDEPA